MYVMTLLLWSMVGAYCNQPLQCPLGSMNPYPPGVSSHIESWLLRVNTVQVTMCVSKAKSLKPLQLSLQLLDSLAVGEASLPAMRSHKQSVERPPRRGTEAPFNSQHKLASHVSAPLPPLPSAPPHTHKVDPQAQPSLEMTRQA